MPDVKEIVDRFETSARADDIGKGYADYTSLSGVVERLRAQFELSGRMAISCLAYHATRLEVLGEELNALNAWVAGEGQMSVDSDNRSWSEITGGGLRLMAALTTDRIDAATYQSEARKLVDKRKTIADHAMQLSETTAWRDSIQRDVERTVSDSLFMVPTIYSGLLSTYGAKHVKDFESLAKQREAILPILDSAKSRLKRVGETQNDIWRRYRENPDTCFDGVNWRRPIGNRPVFAFKPEWFEGIKQDVVVGKTERLMEYGAQFEEGRTAGRKANKWLREQLQVLEAQLDAAQVNSMSDNQVQTLVSKHASLLQEAERRFRAALPSKTTGAFLNVVLDAETFPLSERVKVKGWNLQRQQTMSHNQNKTPRNQPPVAGGSNKQRLYQAMVDAKAKLTTLMTQYDGGSPQVQAAYAEYKKARDAYEAVLQKGDQ